MNTTSAVTNTCDCIASTFILQSPQTHTPTFNNSSDTLNCRHSRADCSASLAQIYSRRRCETARDYCTQSSLTAIQALLSNSSGPRSHATPTSAKLTTRNTPHLHIIHRIEVQCDLLSAMTKTCVEVTAIYCINTC